MTKKIQIALILAVSLFFISYSSSSSSDAETTENKIPPLEIYIVDQETMPKDAGVPNTSYTASVFVIDNEKKQVFGPFKGSSYPNSRETEPGSDKPNTVDTGIHLFNNEYGHKGGTVKGLNLINQEEQRKTDGYSWTKKPTTMSYVNLHQGYSDLGNYNSRGSLGCITIQPDEVGQFWSHFDFSINGTKGTSNGVVYVFRESEEKREQLINEIKNVYQ
ncbi:hypothetical protein [uncultured Kordia sp.]|uniref:hypothetical protein n=1 Tax=uncultured Kordia sp. TaxID=507699 RepID=UPI0026047E66|nr:hypothetical protein [uncultured Kordia sp.]